MSRKKTGRHGYGNPAKRQPVTGDLARLAQPNGVANPRRFSTGGMVGPGGPRDRDAVFFDPTDLVLLDHTEVATVVVSRGGVPGTGIYLTLDGRINKTEEKVRTGFLTTPDGAAGIITQLLGVADRHGADLLKDLTDRLAEMQREGTADLAFLRAAIDNAIEQAGVDMPSGPEVP